MRTYNNLKKQGFLLCMFVLLLLGFSQYMNAQELQPDDFKPGETLIFPMPNLGNSWDSGGTEPVQGCIILPTNFDPSRKHPVWFHLGYGKGDATHVKPWAKMMNKKNYIFIGVDYKSRRRDGFSEAQHLINTLKKAPFIKLKTDRMVVSGQSSGAYAITDGYRSGLGRSCGAYIIVSGGMSISPSALGNRKAVFWLIGENDTKKASGGRSRIAVVREAHKKLKEGGANSTLYVVEGEGHSIPRTSYKDDLRKWVYQWAPPFRKLYAYKKKMEQLTDEEMKTKIAKKLKNHWLYFPWKEEIQVPE